MTSVSWVLLALWIVFGCISNYVIRSLCDTIAEKQRRVVYLERRLSQLSKSDREGTPCDTPTSTTDSSQTLK